MSDQIVVEGKEYISSKRASQLCGYTQDYIGQLARAQLIDSQRIAGLWYVHLPSLESYKQKAESYKPEPPLRKQVAEPDALVHFDGKDYASAARAAELTGYHQDYVGQLARSGTVLSRQVGNRWYVERENLLAHKKAKDALLAAVQKEAVGLPSAADRVSELSEEEFSHAGGPILNYTSDSGDLMPVLLKREGSSEAPEETFEEEKEEQVPIKVIRQKIYPVQYSDIRIKTPAQAIFLPDAPNIVSRKPMLLLGASAVAALTIVIVLSFGFSMLKNNSTYAVKSAFTASAAGAFNAISGVIENLVTKELIYQRQ